MRHRSKQLLSATNHSAELAQSLSTPIRNPISWTLSHDLLANWWHRLSKILWLLTAPFVQCFWLNILPICFRDPRNWWQSTARHIRHNHSSKTQGRDLARLSPDLLANWWQLLVIDIYWLNILSICFLDQRNWCRQPATRQNRHNLSQRDTRSRSCERFMVHQRAHGAKSLGRTTRQHSQAWWAFEISVFVLVFASVLCVCVFSLFEKCCWTLCLM